MSWRNYAWVSTIRGVEPHERNVLYYLADLAGEDGFIASARSSLISERSETPRRRLFQILHDLESKGFLERERRVWNKNLDQPVSVKPDRLAKLGKQHQHEIRVLSKGHGKQLPTGYRLRKDRFFPKSAGCEVWQQVKTKLAKLEIAPAAWRVYIERIDQSYYVARMSSLCLLTADADHKRWIERELRRPILEFGPKLQPRPVTALQVFSRPSIE